jgi:hypothetical protein
MQVADYQRIKRNGPTTLTRTNEPFLLLKKSNVCHAPFSHLHPHKRRSTSAPPTTTHKPTTQVTVIQYSESYDATVAHTFTHLSSPTYPTTSDMPCTLLEKLAAETRVMIYEYVLTFDTPIKHVQKMQPFVEKLTGARSGSGPDQMQSILKKVAEAGSKLIPKSEANDVLRPVDTAILTTRKPVYTEAIAVFYTSNTIFLQAQLCSRRDNTFPHATDLSIATQVAARLKTPSWAFPPGEIRFDKVMEFALHQMPRLFPALHTATIYIDSNFALRFIAETKYLRGITSHDNVSFDRVGSMIAILRDTPCIKLNVQLPDAMVRWASPVVAVPAREVTFQNASANLLCRETRAGGFADPQNRPAALAQLAFDFIRSYPELDIGPVEPDGHEFWTVVDAVLSLFQRR